MSAGDGRMGGGTAAGDASTVVAMTPGAGNACRRVIGLHREGART
jgi:hypothetical protein